MARVWSFGSCRATRFTTTYKRNVANFFDRAGHEVPWQKLAEDFENHEFRFQILDEGDYADRDWRDDLRKLLET